MTVTTIFEPHEKVRTLSEEELRLGVTILRDNMGLKPIESLLVVTDPHMAPLEGALWFEAGKTIAANTHMVVFDGMEQNAQEPPSIVTLMMSKSLVVMLQTTYSLSHTEARKLATKAGARIASLPTASHDILMRTLRADYAPIAQLSITIAALLTKAKTARVTASNGTDITFNIADRTGIDDTGFYTKRGEFGNLPAGEAFIAPIEKTTHGVYVVDGSFADIELDAPITLEVREGLVTSITGKSAADTLKHKLLAVGDPLAYSIAELGIGVNKEADPRGTLIEAEKAYGTVHIAMGNNATIGGTISVPFHSDGVILAPSLYLDDTLVLDNGNFVV